MAGTARRRGWWIAGAVTAVLVVAAGVVFIVTGGRSDGPVAVAPTSSPTSPAGGSAAEVMTVQVYFHRVGSDDPARVVAVPRTVPRSERVATAALGQLIGGTTAEEADRGYRSSFVPATADSLRDVRVADGVAHADFRDFSAIIPDAGSGAGGTALLAELDGTLKQFDTVKSTVYSFDGDVAAFYRWLQRQPPTGNPPDPAPAITAARRFLVDVVRMDRPADGPFRWVGDGNAEATFYSRSPADEPVLGVPTVVALRRAAAGGWEVTGTRADVVQVDTPTSGQPVTSPLRVTGRVHVFEGNVVVRVLVDQGGNTVEIGQGFVTGGGDELRPFSGDIKFTPPNPGTGWVLFTEPSAADGRIVLATSIRVEFARRA
jgi:hypothetical protein